MGEFQNIVRIDKKRAPMRRKRKNGADRDRTDDLYVANVPLSQLSYSPIDCMAGTLPRPTGPQYIVSEPIGKSISILVIHPILT